VAPQEVISACVKLGEIGWNCTFTRNSLYSKTLQRMWSCEIDFRFLKLRKNALSLHP